jgi:mgtE-like transporter
MHLPAILAVSMTESRSRAVERARRAGRLASRQIAEFRKRAGFVWELKSFIRESLVAVLLSLVIVVMAGVLFSSMREALLLLPGLVLLVPGALAMRGNIYASLGARLGTALHTGQLSPNDKGPTMLREEVLVVLVQTLLGTLFLAIVGRMAAILLGIPTVSMVDLAVTAMVGALLAGAVELFVTVRVAMSAHQKGWDPDNVTAPIISAVADLVSIPSLLGAAVLVVWMPGWLTSLIFIILILALFALVAIVARGDHERATTVLAASIPVLLVVLIIVLLPAIMLERMVEELVANPTILILIPPFVAVAGNLGAILASRLSSAAHLGLITLRGSPDRLVYQNLGVILLLSILTFGALGMLTHITTFIIDVESPGLSTLLIITLLGGLVVTAATSLAAYKVTAYTFVKGDDPDNVVIPIITSTMDALGTALVVALFILLVLEKMPAF